MNKSGVLAKVINRTNKKIIIWDKENAMDEPPFKEGLPVGAKGSIFLYKTSEPWLKSIDPVNVTTERLGNRVYIYVEEVAAGTLNTAD